jgi:acetyltransferase-like isoleucine patch superfamily enzyme
MKILARIKFLLLGIVNRIYLLLHGNISVGRYTYGIPRVYFGKALYGKKEVTRLTIGKFCSIPPFRVHVFLGGDHDILRGSSYPLGYVLRDSRYIEGHHKTKGDVVIGNDVWIGIGAVILSGVKIGDGAVVGAYSVVRTKVPPYAIVIGNPAQIVGYRFSQEKIGALLKIKWWDWDIRKIKKALPLLTSYDMDAFISYCQGRE